MSKEYVDVQFLAWDHAESGNNKAIKDHIVKEITDNNICMCFIFQESYGSACLNLEPGTGYAIARWSPFCLIREEYKDRTDKLIITVPVPCFPSIPTHVQMTTSDLKLIQEGFNKGYFDKIIFIDNYLQVKNKILKENKERGTTPGGDAIYNFLLTTKRNYAGLPVREAFQDLISDIKVTEYSLLLQTVTAIVNNEESEETKRHLLFKPLEPDSKAEILKFLQRIDDLAMVHREVLTMDNMRDYFEHAFKTLNTCDALLSGKKLTRSKFYTSLRNRARVYLIFGATHEYEPYNELYNNLRIKRYDIGIRSVMRIPGIKTTPRRSSWKVSCVFPKDLKCVIDMCETFFIHSKYDTSTYTDIQEFTFYRERNYVERNYLTTTYKKDPCIAYVFLHNYANYTCEDIVNFPDIIFVIHEQQNDYYIFYFVLKVNPNHVKETAPLLKMNVGELLLELQQTFFSDNLILCNTSENYKGLYVYGRRGLVYG